MTRPARYDFSCRPVAHDDAVVAGDQYRFTILTDGLLRCEWAADGRFEDRASTFAVNRKLSVPDYYVWDRGHRIEIVTKRFHVVYNKKKFSEDGLIIQLKGAISGKWKYGQEPQNLGGTARTLDGANGRIPLGSGVLSRDGIAVLDDTKSMLFAHDGWIAPRRSGDRCDHYIFLYGHDYRDAMRAYFAVSGSQPLLPRYAMGNWWSRYHAYDEKEYLQLHNHFARDNVPMNVAVVDMDWHLVHNLPDNMNGWTGYTWNTDLFPDPDAFMQKLHDRGMKLTLNLHPADGIRHHERQYPAVARALGIDPETKEPANFDCTDKKFMDAYFDIVHHEHEARGVDFWWVDWQQGNSSKIPGVDPLWVLNHFHFLDIGRGRQRPMIFSRFGGPGAQRYQLGFSGDAIITWESLHFQPEFTATASNIGYGWWSNDIGGHTHGYKDDELTTRWVQLGCWSPILRLHSDNNPFNTREPWRYRDEMCGIMEETLRLRHRLIPYLYTMNACSASDDEPLVQPMYWDYPDEEETYQVPNQYRFGSELIVAPITQPRSKMTFLGETKAWLPAKKRFADLFTGTVYSRKGHLQFHRPLSQTPVLAPEGAIVPLDGAWCPKTGSPNPTTLEIILVVGADGYFDLIEDDGTGSQVDDGGFRMVDDEGIESSDSKSVRFCHTPITYKQSTGVLKIGPTSSSDDPSIPQSREWKIRLIAHTLSSNAEIRCITTSSPKKAKAQAYTIQTCDNGTLINIGSVPSSSSCIIELLSSTAANTKGPQLDVIDPIPRVVDIIDKAQTSMELKRRLGNIVQSHEPVMSKVRTLQNKGLQKDLLDPMLELLLADERYGDDCEF